MSYDAWKVLTVTGIVGDAGPRMGMACGHRKVYARTFGFPVGAVQKYAGGSSHSELFTILPSASG